MVWMVPWGHDRLVVRELPQARCHRSCFVLLSQTLIGIAYPQSLPPGLDGLVNATLSDRLLEDFKFGVVLSFDGRPTRLAISDEGEPGEWLAWIRSHWGERAVEFANSGPVGCRRMIDTDGVHARIFLDDLQDHGSEEMCRILSLPDGTVSRYTRHEQAPLGRMPPEVRRTAERLTGGVWGLLWTDQACTGALWISESRWRGDVHRTTSMVETVFTPPKEWYRCRDALAQHGWVMYPDAVELGANGEVDVTLGWVRGS